MNTPHFLQDVKRYVTDAVLQTLKRCPVTMTMYI